MKSFNLIRSLLIFSLLQSCTPVVAMVPGTELCQQLLATYFPNLPSKTSPKLTSEQLLRDILNHIQASKRPLVRINDRGVHSSLPGVEDAIRNGRKTFAQVMSELPNQTVVYMDFTNQSRMPIQDWSAHHDLVIKIIDKMTRDNALKFLVLTTLDSILFSQIQFSLQRAGLLDRIQLLNIDPV